MAQEAKVREGTKARATAARGPPPALAGFIRYLEESGLADLRLEGGEPYSEADRDEADSMARLQALVVLANRLGLGAPYECDGYAGGPVSTPLAEDAHVITADRAKLYDSVPACVPGTFKKEEFEELVRGRDTDWLMAASKMTDLRDRLSTRERLIDSVTDHDIPGVLTYTREYVSSVLGELESAGLVAPYP